MTPPLSELLRRLLTRGHRGMVLGLERVRAGARSLGDPQDGLSVLHVAGTNGKGSTAAMLESIARVAGRRTGLYTSPHLSRFAERIRIDGAPIDDERFAEALAKVFADATDELTFFETLTLAAYVAFRDASVDVVVLEVGLGGRLDATNIVPAPRATAIVSIAEGIDGRFLEHANLLGDGVSAIAREKAGIAKRGVPLVLGPLAAEARVAVLEAAHAAGAAPIFEVVSSSEPRADVRALLLDRSASTIALGGGLVVPLAPSLAGPHQVANAAVAVATAHAAALGFSPGDLARGVAGASWPGRLERIEHAGRTFVLDAAHNVDGARALVEALGGSAGAERTLLVFGALADKAYAPMLEILAPLAARRLFASPEGRAPAPLEALVAIASGETEPRLGRVVARAVELTSPGDTVLVAGSIYLVGAVRAALLGIATDPTVAL
jgi:dihydrofolate synthase/folylpolyglutamate synthase